MKIAPLLAFILLVHSIGEAAKPAEFFVAPNGRDSNPGNERKPFATLDRARDAVRKARKKQSRSPVQTTVWIRGGTYSLKNTFELTVKDSSIPSAPTIYRAFKDEQPRFIGGIDFSMADFQKVTDPAILRRIPEIARTNVLQVNLRKFGVRDFGKPWPERFRGYNGWPELFFDGRPMHLARWPNTDFAKMGAVLEAGSKPRYNEKPDKPGKFTYEGNRPERWLTSDEVFLNGYWAYKWFDECLKVAQITPSEKSIQFAAPHTYGIGGPSGGDFYAFNLLEELDAPEEYYLDRQTGILYFWPPTATARSLETTKDSSTVSLSILQTSMVSLTNVSAVIFEGLRFEASRGLAIAVNGGSDVLITNCVIRNLAEDAVAITGGASNGIAGCEIYGVGGAGISLDGGDRTNLVACRNFAENNHIHHFGRLFHTRKDALFLSGCGCVARHNLIHDAPHHAMDFTGNNHLIEFNEIHHVCMETDDAGAIYTGRHWSVQGNVIRHNFIHDIGGGPHVGNQGIYLDDCAAGTICEGNIICHTGRGFLIGGGRDNVIRNNILIDCPVPVYFDNRGIGSAASKDEDWNTLTTDLKSMPYQEEPWKSAYPYLLDYFDNKPGYPVRNKVERNLIVRCGEMQIASEARELGTVRHNFSTSVDPGFIDAAHSNYRIKDNTILEKHMPGFEAVPFAQMGLSR